MKSWDREIKKLYSCADFFTLWRFSHWLASAVLLEFRIWKIPLAILKQKSCDSNVRDPIYRSSGDASGQFQCCVTVRVKKAGKSPG